MAKVIDKLREDLDLALMRLAETQAEIADLQRAIASLEANPIAGGEISATRKRRGAVSRLVLDCIRRGIGEVRLIKRALEADGHSISSNSISNAISRMHRRYVWHDPQTNKWVPIALPTNEKGSANLAEPSHMNGAAG